MLTPEQAGMELFTVTPEMIVALALAAIATPNANIATRFTNQPRLRILGASLFLTSVT